MCQGTILTAPILCHLSAFPGEEGKEDCETNGGKVSLEKKSKLKEE